MNGDCIFILSFAEDNDNDAYIKDDNFITIVSAISEGRTIFKNIRKKKKIIIF
jgi:magnesium-transporting ATPase (P-type)